MSLDALPDLRNLVYHGMHRHILLHPVHVERRNYSMLICRICFDSDYVRAVRIVVAVPKNSYLRHMA